MHLSFMVTEYLFGIGKGMLFVKFLLRDGRKFL